MEEPKEHMKLDRGRLNFAGAAAALAVLGATTESALQAGIEPAGNEYSMLGRQIGDQFFSQLSLDANQGGFLVWQDNNIDEDGLGIRAVRLDHNLNPTLGAFRVNQGSIGDQQRPDVTQLPDGGAAFVWESENDIYIRFMSGEGVFVAGDQKVNSYVPNVQKDPAIVTLDNDNIVVVWSSVGQDGDMQGVFGQLFSPEGKKLGGEFLVNQSFRYNQRTPSVAPLSEGDFVVGWISEELIGISNRADENGRILDPTVGGERYNIQLKGRVFDENGLAVSDEIALGDPNVVNANPSLVAVSDGFMAFYSGRGNLEMVSDMSQIEDGWDIYGQRFDETGEKVGPLRVINETRYGDQVVPAVASSGEQVFVAWTGLGHDGDREGVFGRSLALDGSTDSAEFQINSITANRQFLPTVGIDDQGNALAIWSGYTGGKDSFDLKAQRFTLGNPLPTLDAPFVYGTGYWSIGVSWPALSGVDVTAYEVYLDGSDVPVTVSGNTHLFTDLNAGSTHQVTVAYVLPDGTRSAVSPAGIGNTWGRDTNFDQLPDDWQSKYFGVASVSWPGAEEDTDGDGVTNLDELLAGTNPVDSSSLLETQVVKTPAGVLLEWNTQAGGIYQVQVTTDVSTWFDAGGPRLAVDEFDSISIVSDQGIAVYRVLRLR